MRHLILLGFAILLSGCASTTNHYQQTVRSWHGANINTLVKQWGRPDSRLAGSNGNIILVYYTKSNQSYHDPVSPVGINVDRDGRPVIVNTPNTNHTWNRGAPSLTCSALFEINSKGLIISTKSLGTGCLGGDAFAKRLSNPSDNSKFTN